MPLTRRDFLAAGLASGTSMLLPGGPAIAQAAPAVRIIPSTGETIPAIGLGTWITFNVGEDEVLRDECTAVLAAFVQGGGRMVDSSPMYGSSQAVIGYGLRKIGLEKSVFSADKVWTSSGAEGPGQIERSRQLWSVPRFDLLQVHNLLAFEEHLGTLLDMKSAGRVRYIGITTSEGRRHDLFEEVMRRYPLDFIQVTYNPVDREVEDRILPLALDRGTGVIVNRPFQQGALTRHLEGEPLPDWAGELGAATWAQLILKFVLSHPAVTTAIPATTRVDHVRENLSAASGPAIDQATRERIAAHIQDL